MMDDTKVIIIGMGQGETTLTREQIARFIAQEMLITFEEAVAAMEKINDVSKMTSNSIKDLVYELRKLEDLDYPFIEEESNPYILRPKNNHHFQKIITKPRGNHWWRNFQPQSRSSI